MSAYILTLSATLLACFAIQTLALKKSGGRPAKSESNFFSSLARIQYGASIEASTMLLGSSLTGRLPDQSSGFDGVANLGCDGGSAADTLRAIERGVLPGAPVLIVEGNTLYRARPGLHGGLAKAMDGAWFKIGLRIPQLSAAARPSGFIYSMLLSKRIGDAQGPDGDRLPVETAPGFPELGEVEAEDRGLVAELGPLIERLEASGMKPVIVILPPGGSPGSPEVSIPARLSVGYGISFWDLTDGLPPNAINLTDGLHMDSESAAATLRTLLTGIGEE